MPLTSGPYAGFCLGWCERQKHERLGGNRGYISPGKFEKSRNQVIEVYFSCILRVLLTLPLRLSGPLRQAPFHPPPPPPLTTALNLLLYFYYTGGGTRVPAKLVDLDPQAHKFAEVWGWRIIVGEYFSADFQPAPFQYRWVKTANSSEQAAAGQSQLTNITWNDANTEKSRILQELQHKAMKTSGKLSIRFNMDSFNEFPQAPYFGWGRIIGN